MFQSVVGGYLTTKPEVSQTLFVRYLLRHLQANGHQTWYGPILPDSISVTTIPPYYQFISMRVRVETPLAVC